MDMNNVLHIALAGSIPQWKDLIRNMSIADQPTMTIHLELNRLINLELTIRHEMSWQAFKRNLMTRTRTLQRQAMGVPLSYRLTFNMFEQQAEIQVEVLDSDDDEDEELTWWSQNADWGSKPFLDIARDIATYDAERAAAKYKEDEEKGAVDLTSSAGSDSGRAENEMNLDAPSGQDKPAGQERDKPAGGDMACDAEQERLSREREKLAEVQRRRDELARC